MKTVLVVINEPELARRLSGHLQKAGYRVVSAGDGQTALTTLRRERPNLVLLDLTLDGLALCRRLRRASDAPILVLTPRVEQAERVVGQEVCADDFVLRPFDPRQVVARTQILLRWAERRVVVNPDVIWAGDLALNPIRRQAIVAGEPVDLTRTELELLTALATEPGRAFTRAQLVSALNADYAVSERTIDCHVKNLRHKIEPDPRHPRYILTVHGVGYKVSE